ncbi:MAG TPA: aspartyl protease family protein [Candidatus Rubrimentiphilum sp.]|nr:aspartyl protease family protein [Candidatus Rubrimentiphilum sp.]
MASLLMVCAGAASATDQYLPANLSAPEIVARGRTARGTLAPGRYVIVDRIRGGGIERVRTTHIDGPNSIAIVQAPMYTTASGVYNGQGWNQDENGVVLLRSDFRRYVDPNTQALLHPENPDYHVSVLGLTRTQPQEYVIEANPPGGSDQVRYYDAKTFLVDRFITFDADLHQHVTEFSDYRSVFGSLRPFRIHSYDGRPQNDTVTETVSFEQAPANSAPVAMPTSRPLYTIDKPLSIPATFGRSGIIVRVTVNGRGLDFLLDSGAGGLAIDPGVAHQLGLTTYGRSNQTIGGEVDVSRTRIPELDVGPLKLHDVAFSVIPMNYYTDGVRIVGILGCDFIASSIVGIDFQKSTVTLYPDSFDPHALGMATLPLQMDDGVPRVQASFEGVPGFFLVDTGATGTVAYDTYVKKLKSAQPLDEGVSLNAIGGTVPAQLKQLTDLKFGGIHFGDAMVFVPSSSTFNLSDYDGILGRDVLSQYQLYFNYAKRQLYIKPA